jgi:hypothetical protein
MNRFFVDPFPVRLRPALAFDYVIAYSNEIERECICNAPIEVTRRKKKKSGALFVFFLLF